jgi:cytochrome c-type biogenesis protein CcmF
MIPELGQFALCLALAVALVQVSLPALGVWRGDVRMMSVARNAALAQFACVALAYACLLASFINADFSVVNVAQNANSELPLHYRITASWGSHEGSLLLWILMQAAWTLALATFSRQLPLALVARVLAVMGFISCGFLLFMLMTSNPFDRLLPAALEGKDLNPLLQDPGMIFHPPLLYMGYVGFSVAFAFAVAALWSGRLDAAWCRFARPWTLAAWSFLTAGIALGSFWAYYELGWGGWWFWDPVENASFMPWLVGTALIHSLAVSEKRGVFKSWTVLLAIIAFSLSLLGTFLVRSGVLTSVHAFATDPTRGVFILVFLMVVIGGALALYAWRSGLVTPALDAISFSWRSRESFLLANNVLMVVAAFAVLLGTLYPLIIDALGMGKISVGPPYFDAVFLPLMAPAAVLLALAPFSRWKHTENSSLKGPICAAGIGAVIAGLALPWLYGKFSIGVAFGIALGTWVCVGSVLVLRERLRHANKNNFFARVTHTPGSVWGMVLAHFGIGMFIFGVALVNGWDAGKDVVLKPNVPVSLGALNFTLRAQEEVKGPNYAGLRALVDVREGEKLLYTLAPEKRQYRARGQVMTEAGIDMGLARHVYVSLANPLDNGAWGARVQIKPYISWIWLGCVMMALGGLAALLDRRYRKSAIPAAQNSPISAGISP